MADLSPLGATARTSDDERGARRRGRERAQLILITGFMIAVVLVALAVVMNAAIYTENLATRSESSGATDAVVYERTLERAVQEAFRYAHQSSGATDYPGLKDSVRQAVTDLNDITMRQQVRSGHVPNATVLGMTRGTRIWDTTGDFTDKNGNDDWLVAADVDEVRNFEMELQESSLPTEPNDEFRVVADFVSGGRWYMNVTSDGGSGVVVGINASGDYATCPAGGTVTIDLMAGTVDGKECPPLDFTDVVGADSNFTMTFENGTQAKGDYSLVVEKADGALSGVAPNEDKVLYKTVIELVYRTKELDYRGRFEVAPGEPNE